MKKLLAILTVLAVMAVPMFVFAAAPTPMTDSTMKIWVTNTFTRDDTAFTSAQDETAWVGSGVDALEAEFKNNAYYINKISVITDIQFRTQDTTFVKLENGAGAIGFGFKVKNELSAAVKVDPHFYGNSFFWGKADATVYISDMNGNVTSKTLEAFEANPGDNRYCLDIPAGFEGYVILPFDCMANGWNDNPLDPTSWVNTSLMIGSFTPETGKAFIVDNCFIYGDSTMASNASLEDLGIVATPATADLSVIAYAVAALTGCGALVVATKKK